MIRNVNRTRSEMQLVHVHEFHVPTSFNAGHTHLVAGVTAPSSGGLDLHTHYYRGVTTLDDGHTHHFEGTTGPAVRLPGGGHAHKFGRVTSCDFGHVHYYQGLTRKGVY